MANKKQIISAAQKLVNMRAAVAHMDGWVNNTTGYGISGYDKTADYRVIKNVRMQREALEALYTDNDLAATMIDRPVDDALRQGYNLTFEGARQDPELAHDIVMWAETTYNVTEELMFALRWSRLYGGGAVVYGIDDGRDFDQPPREKSPINFLRAESAPDLWTLYWHADPSKQNFGKPAVYQWNMPSFVPSVPNEKSSPKVIQIDAGRLEAFPGVISTRRNYIERRGWGDSILRRVIDVLTKFDTAWGSIMALLQDASQGVYKVKGLDEALSSDNAELIEQRFQLINLGKSAFKAIALDADGEDYQRIATPLTEMSDVIEKAMLRVSSAARMPVTKLFGDSPSGMIGEGAGETRDYYDTIKAQQTFSLGPALQRIYARLLAQPDSPTNGVVPEDLKIWFPSLWQLSPKDEAALYQMQSQADGTNIEKGVFSAEEAAIHRAHNTTPFGFPKIDIDARLEIQEAQREADRMLAESGQIQENKINPPTPPAAPGAEDEDEESNEGSDEDATENNEDQ